MASHLLSGCLRSCSRQQGTTSNLLNRCWLASCQQQTVTGQSNLHTVSYAGLTAGAQSRCTASSPAGTDQARLWQATSCANSSYTHLILAGAQISAVPQLVNLRHFRVTASKREGACSNSCPLPSQHLTSHHMQHHVPNETFMRCWEWQRMLETVTLRKRTTSLQSSITQIPIRCGHNCRISSDRAALSVLPRTL